MRPGLTRDVDELRTRITEDLTGLLKGELRCDPLTVAMYATDASLYQVLPLGVAYPRDREDVETLARFAAEAQVPLIPRGGGSGVAGAAVGAGLVVDFSRHMRRIESLGSETVRVQTGIVRSRLNEALRQYGRYFPPDPSSTTVTTVGGMLGVDAAGSHSVRVGSTRDHVQSIEMVLAGGDVMEFGDDPLPPRPPGGEDGPARPGEPNRRSAAFSGESAASKKALLLSRLEQLLSDHAALIQERQPAGVRNSCGYYLRGVRGESQLHVPRLLVGSEGTLGLFTAATLHTMLLPEHRGVVLLLFGQLEAAARSVHVITPQQPSACDLLDRRLLTLAREADPRFAQLISPQAEAALIVEQIGATSLQVRDRIRQVVDAVTAASFRAVVAAEAYEAADVDFLWSLPATVVPLLTRLKGVTRPLPFVEDVAVPPAVLHEFLVKAQKVFQKHEVTASLYSHAAAGQLHLRPFLPLNDPHLGARIEAIARDLYQVVLSVGGSISGEHGDGLARTAFVRSQYGPLYRVFQQVKEIFDPQRVMNPGKIINDDPHVTRRNLRPPPVPAPQFVELQLQWSADELTQAAARCNGCGVCRTQEAGLRMCPFFRIDALEEASPRSKANVARHYLCGQLEPREFASPEMKRLANLCFNCKQCQLECPSNVNVPHMMIEAKAAYVAANGLGRADWLLSRAHSFGKLGCAAAMASNWIISNPVARWVMEHTLGIARQRKLPLFARRSFLQTYRARALKPTVGGASHKPVIYFVDHYANFHDPELAQAWLAILRHHRIEVHVPPGQTGSGMAMICAGDLDAARDVAVRNLRELAEFAREGHTIVCTEPAAALCLKYEYPMLLDHPDVPVVAAQVLEAGQFLEQLRLEGRFRSDFRPLSARAGYHTPCHLKALTDGRSGGPLERLLTLIPGLRLTRIEKGCSGMAGAYGLTRENFRTSIRIGWPLIERMRQGDLDIGTTECSSCKIQMEQGATIPTLHPVKLMALAYGLMPEIERKLEPIGGKLTVS